MNSELTKENAKLKRDLELAYLFCPVIPPLLEDPDAQGFGPCSTSSYPCCGGVDQHKFYCKITNLHKILDKYHGTLCYDHDYCTCGHLLAAHSSDDICFGQSGRCDCVQYNRKETT